MVQNVVQIKNSYKLLVHNCLITKWAQLGMIQRPPDYESGALTNWAIGPKTNGLFSKMYVDKN